MHDCSANASLISVSPQPGMRTLSYLTLVSETFPGGKSALRGPLPNFSLRHRRCGNPKSTSPPSGLLSVAEQRPRRPIPVDHHSPLRYHSSPRPQEPGACRRSVTEGDDSQQPRRRGCGSAAGLPPTGSKSSIATPCPSSPPLALRRT
jgi:hypothetical protein